MKSFKKLFAIVATAAMLSTLVQTSAFAAGFSDELQGAYDYAYGIGVTTQGSIDSANMYGTLIRSHMAKMMVNYATEVLKKTPDTSVKVNFTDIADQSTELQGYIEEAAQLGLMGLNADGSVATSFNPNGVVTRAQFGTVLDRAINGDANNGSEPYYAAHLSALKAAGIMTNISTPNATEIRGYVMLMLERADGNTSTPATCSTAENILACTLGTSACPAECKDTTTPEVKAGSLNVSLNSSSVKADIPSTGTVRFAVVDFKAGSDDISLRTVEVKKVGLSSFPTSSRVWFEKDGVRISGKAAFTSDGIAIVSFAPTYVVKAGSTASLDLYVELATTAGQDLQLTSNNIDSSAQDVNGSFTTPILRTANYTVAPVLVTPISVGGTYNATANSVELGQFNVENKDTSSEIRDVNLKSITLRQNGNASLDNLSSIILVRNGVTVAKNPTINGRDLTFSSVNDTIKDGTTAKYYVKAVIDSVEFNGGDTYQFGIRYTTDVNAVEVTSAFRSTVTVATNAFGTYTVNGGDMTFAKDSSIALASNYAAGSDVTLMQGTISAKNSVTLEDITLSGSAITESGLSAYFSTIYLKVAGSTFSYSPAAGSANTAITFLGSATINGTSAVRLYGKLRDTAPVGSIKFQDLNLTSIKIKQYVSSQNDVTSSIGSIPGITVTVQGAALNVTKIDGLGDQGIAQGANGLLVYGIKLSSNQGNPISVSNAVFDITAPALLNNNAYATLYVNGSAVGSKTVSGSTVSFDSFNVTVDQTHPATLEIKADITDAFTAGAVSFKLASINAVDTLTSNSVNPSALPQGATFTIASAGATVATSDNNPQAQLLLSPSTAAKLLAFKVTAKNDNVALYDVNVSGTALAGLSNFAIVDASGTVIATATTNRDTAVIFNQIANAPKVLKDKSATYYVVADVNSNTNVAAVNLTINSLDLKATNGTVVNPTAFSPIASRTHGISENTLVVAKAANTSKLLTTSALRFTVTAAGKNSVSINSVDLTTLLAGYIGGTVNIYKDSVSSANLVANGAIGDGSYTFDTANNTVDAGNTVTYIVAIEGAVVDPAAFNSDWSVSLTNVNFGAPALDANAFFNVGSFPITEVK